MEKEQQQEIINFFESKRKECLVQKIAYEKWLDIVTPWRWAAIIAGVILPLVASVFKSFIGISSVDWVAIILLLSGLVSGIHTALKCDFHQQECLRLSKQYEALANKFEYAKSYSIEELKLRKEALNDALSDLIANTLTTPTSKCISAAKKEVYTI